MLFYIIGFFTFAVGDLYIVSHPLESNRMIYFFFLLLFYVTMCAIVWFIPILMIKLWLQDFTKQCGYNANIILDNCRKCFDLYSAYEEAFKKAFILFFGMSQIMSIIMIYSSFSSFLINSSFSIDECLHFLGFIFTFAGN